VGHVILDNLSPELAFSGCPVLENIGDLNKMLIITLDNDFKAYLVSLWFELYSLNNTPFEHEKTRHGVLDLGKRARNKGGALGNNLPFHWPILDSPSRNTPASDN
jgi:hypothetical protein